MLEQQWQASPSKAIWRAKPQALVMEIMVRVASLEHWACFLASANSPHATKNALVQAFIQHHLNALLPKRPVSSDPIITVAHTAQGKPYLPDFPAWQFSLSHSQRHVALAVSPSPHPIGVDMESIPRRMRPEVVAASLNESEYAYFQQQSQLELAQRYWLKVWTVKEAVFKAAGTGITDLPNHWNSHATPAHAKGTMHYLEQDYPYHCFEAPDWQLALAWQGNETAHIDLLIHPSQALTLP